MSQAGLVAGALIGLSLGALGGGGSILAVPVLVSTPGAELISADQPAEVGGEATVEAEVEGARCVAGTEASTVEGLGDRSDANGLQGSASSRATAWTV